MGRVNNTVEIIPVDGPSGSNSRQNYKDTQEYIDKKMSYMSDPFIVQRVRQYLEANVDKTYVDITEMADFLQDKFPEYSRRKKDAFRGLVKKAYGIVVRSYGTDLGVSSSESDVEEGVDVDEDTSLNDHLLQMYQQQTKAAAISVNDELIDISSDEDFSVQEPKTAAVAAKNEKMASNGAIAPTATNKQQLEDSGSTQSERSRKRKNNSATVGGSVGTKRKKEDGVLMQHSKVTFKNIGGMGAVRKVVRRLLRHMRHPDLYKQIGIAPPRGFLLHGPPGTGKTLLANAIAGELNVPLINVVGPELVAGVSGESEQRIRTLFQNAVMSAPCVLFIDEVDAIAQNRQQAQKDMERRIVAQLISCLDELNQNENAENVLLIGATNRPDSLDPALRRAGRFDKEVCLGIPNVEGRMQILKVLTAPLKLAPDFDCLHIAKCTPGFVGADLFSLTQEAAVVRIDRMFTEFDQNKKALQTKEETKELKVSEEDKNETVTEEAKEVNATEVNAKEVNAKEVNAVEPKDETNVEASKPELEAWLDAEGQSFFTSDQLSEVSIQMSDFMDALKCVQPSAKREGFSTVPDVTWDDVGSLKNVREELQMAILAPVRYSEEFKKLGLKTPVGVLLCGPPGCGKTLLAKAISNEAGINFISVKGPELLNMYVGESERAVRQCFQRARNSVPCVIFFDEFDALCPKRSDSGEGGASMRVVNQMLTEMDGMEDRQGVFLMAATNRPDIIDPAVLRPGRFDKILYVGLPSVEDRFDILTAITKKGTEPVLASDVDLAIIAKCEECNGYTGADLAALVREAGIQAMKERMLNLQCAATTIVVTNEHFKKALTKIKPSVSEKDQKRYEKLRLLYSPGVKDIPEEEVMECS